VDFSTDDNTLASGSFDNTVILWDVSDKANPVQLSQLAGHTSSVLSVDFSADDNTLASGSDDSTVILWDVSVESLKEKACRRAGRNLTQAEWERYLGTRPYNRTCPQHPEGS
jgi:WD40 repeat protein